LIKKNEEMDSIKTDEDVSAVYNNIATFLQRASESDVTSDICDTLDMLLKGCTSASDFPDFSSMSTFGSGYEPSPIHPSIPPSDEFGQFVDFSSCGNQDEEDVPTPELVPSSSTNPSPSSVSDADATNNGSVSDTVKIADSRKEQDLLSTSLGLGPFGEIDGGESAYYQSHPWKWDGPMPVLDQPWAFTA
jgi:hypothetical protein